MSRMLLRCTEKRWHVFLVNDAGLTEYLHAEKGRILTPPHTSHHVKKKINSRWILSLNVKDNKPIQRKKKDQQGKDSLNTQYQL